MNIKLKLGNFLQGIGWDLRPRHKVPFCNADLAGIGMSLLRRANQQKIIHVLQVGAFDGVTADPLSSYLTAGDVRAVLLEPQPEPFRKLNTKYKDFENIQTLNLAMAEHDGTLQMWSNDMEGGSAMASSAVGHGRRFAMARDSLKPFMVECTTGASLLKKLKWRHIDFLQVDVEGMDWKVVSQFLAMESQPSVVNFEIIHLSKVERIESEKRLCKLGYQIIDGGYDRFAFQGMLLR
jgi:FkbM family methyltransferase